MPKPPKPSVLAQFVVGAFVAESSGLVYEIVFIQPGRVSRALKLRSVRTGRMHWTGWWNMGTRYVITKGGTGATTQNNLA